MPDNLPNGGGDPDPDPDPNGGGGNDFVILDPEG